MDFLKSGFVFSVLSLFSIIIIGKVKSDVLEAFSNLNESNSLISSIIKFYLEQKHKDLLDSAKLPVVEIYPECLSDVDSSALIIANFKKRVSSALGVNYHPISAAIAVLRDKKLIALTKNSERVKLAHYKHLLKDYVIPPEEFIYIRKFGLEQYMLNVFLRTSTPKKEFKIYKNEEAPVFKTKKPKKDDLEWLSYFELTEYPSFETFVTIKNKKRSKAHPQNSGSNEEFIVYTKMLTLAENYFKSIKK